MKHYTLILALTLLANTVHAQAELGTITIHNGLTWDHGGEPNLSGFRLYVAPVGVTNLAAFVLVDEVQTNGWWGDRTRQLHGPMWLYATAVATNTALTLHSYTEALDEWVAVGDTNAPLTPEMELVEVESEPSEVVLITFRAGVPAQPSNYQLFTVMHALATNALPPLPE